MKITCTTCSYESIMVRAKNLLPQIIHIDGGFLDSSGYHCPNGHHCDVVPTGSAGVRKLPGPRLPGSESTAYKLLLALYNNPGITFVDLVLLLWRNHPEHFGFGPPEYEHPDTNKVQTLLSSKRLKPLLNRPSPRTHELSDEGKELMNEHSKSEREGKGHNSARNGGRTVERTIRTGRVSRIVGRGMRNELATSKRP